MPEIHHYHDKPPTIDELPIGENRTMFPKQEDIIEPLLRYIRDQGGWIRFSREKYDLLEQLGAHFRLAEEEMGETISSGAQTRWYNHVCWARKKAVESGHLDGSVRDIWRITDLGRDFIS